MKKPNILTSFFIAVIILIIIQISFSIVQRVQSKQWEKERIEKEKEIQETKEIIGEGIYNLIENGK